MSFKTLVVLMVLFSGSYSKILPLPSFIKRCSVSAPDFDECCLKNGREAIPVLLKGIKKYNVPYMLPLVIPSIVLDSGPDFSLLINDLEIHNLDKADLKRVTFDVKNKKISGELFIKKLELLGKYEVNGKILLIPIQGKGNINVTADDFAVIYQTDYILEEKRGVEFLKVGKGSADFTTKKAYLQLDNLFNGNKELGESTNKVLNENWEQVAETLKPVITETIVKIAGGLIDGLGKVVPFKEVFLD